MLLLDAEVPLCCGRISVPLLETFPNILLLSQIGAVVLIARMVLNGIVDGCQLNLGSRNLGRALATPAFAIFEETIDGRAGKYVKTMLNPKCPWIRGCFSAAESFEVEFRGHVNRKR